MAIPVDDGLRIGLWCREQTPEESCGVMRIECEIADRHVTVFDARAPWDGSDGLWSRTPVARLRYTGTTGLWSLYWCDSAGRFHEYRSRRPAKRVQTLLDHLAHSGDPIFWG